MNVFEKIEAQQKGIENSPAWMVGEQLKEICRHDASYCSIVCEDLENEDMSISKAERKIKAWADKQKKTGNCVCVPPHVADKIIREFYGLPEEEKKPQPVPEQQPYVALDLSSFF